MKRKIITVKPPQKVLERALHAPRKKAEDLKGSTTIEVKKMTLEDLVAVSSELWSTFSVCLCFAVYDTSGGGKGEPTFNSCFQRRFTADAFVEGGVDPAYRKIQALYLLTDGKVGFRLDEESMPLEDDPSILAAERRKVLEAMSPTRRRLMDLRDPGQID
jgi:hypothetical protein